MRRVPERLGIADFGLERVARSWSRPARDDRQGFRAGSALVHLLSAVLLVTSAAGCAALFPRNPHEEAAERWNKVRGRIKLQLARDQFAAGRMAEAESQLKEAIGLDSKSPEAQVLLAKLSLEKGEIVAAKAALEAAVQLGGSSPESNYLFGLIAQRYGDLDAALAYYREASDRAPQHAAYVAAQAEALVALGRLTEALELIDSRRVDFDRNATLRILAGDVHCILGQYEQAADAYRDAVALAPGDRQVLLQLGVSLARAGRHQEAINVLAPAVAESGETPWSARLALGRAYVARRDFFAARDVFRDAARASASEAEPWTWLGRVALACDDLIGARQAAEKATFLGPRNAASWLLLGYVCERQTDYASARKAYESSLRLEPGDPLVHCLLGQVLEAEGRKGEAVSHYKRAIEANSSYGWARELLAMAEAASTGR